MKLVEALCAIRHTPDSARPMSIHMVCGFTPLHLPTFLAAHLQARVPDRKAIVSTGIYGDCLGNLERLAAQAPRPECGVVVLEWSDFDPRLGLRNLGGWGPHDLRDILETVASQVIRFTSAVEKCAGMIPLRVCLPTLSLPPVSYLPGVQAGEFEWTLQSLMAEGALAASRWPTVAILNPQRLDTRSPLHLRRDVGAELGSGFPYRIEHASTLGNLLAELVAPSAPKKGLITDLDNTLWRGLVGEIGAEKISWNLNENSHSHGLYQQMLRSLGEAGILLAVASKNDPAVVTQAFQQREDLAALRDRIFPFEVSWNPKSKAVDRILQAWNIGAENVVFIDDSPIELAEVKAAWPEVTCLPFPIGNDSEVFALLEELRGLFGKPSVSEDDSLRLESLRKAQVFRKGSGAVAAPEAFLAGIESELTLSTAKLPAEPRVFELVNKTNQFNLNGRRYTEGDWLAFLHDPRSWLLAVSYKDKFGPLGTIAAVAGRFDAGVLQVNAWVMSCRAFSRRVEHACLRYLYDRFETSVIRLDFEATSKNGPLQQFLAGLLKTESSGPVELSRLAFESSCPQLYHRIKEIANG